MVESFVVRQTGDSAAIRVGDVLGRSFGLFSARLGPFIGLSLLAYAPALIYGLIVLRWSNVGSLQLHSLIGFVVRLACASLANAAIIYGVVQELRGRGFTFAESLRVGFGRMGAVIGLSLLVGLFVGLAALLLLVPGIIVWCMYAVAGPVCVVERRGVRASMRRSSFLTKGNRWRIFGIMVLIFIASMVFGAVVAFLAARIGGGYFVQVATFLMEAVVGAFNSVMVGVLYFHLRVAREGADIEKIAAVFD